MINYITKLFIFSISVYLLTFQSGCQNLGPKYQRVEKIPEGKAVVYVYKRGPRAPRGIGVVYTVWANDRPVVNLHQGGYFPFFLYPGKTRIWQKTSKGDVTLDIEAAKSYYVKAFVTMRWMNPDDFVVMDPAIAEKEIAKCRLIPIGK